MYLRSASDSGKGISPQKEALQSQEVQTLLGIYARIIFGGQEEWKAQTSLQHEVTNQIH